MTLPRPATATWPTDPLVNVPLCAAAGDQEYPMIVTDGAGGAVVTWQDYRSGTNYDICAQRVLASGAVDPAWPVNGRAVCTAPDDQRGPTLVTDGAGGAIVTWQDYRSGTNYDIYAQHVLASGALDPAWPTDGRALCTAAGDQDWPVIVEDGAGGAIVTWTDHRSGTSEDIYAQHVLASGAADPAWPADGRGLCTAPNDQCCPVLATDGAGGAIVTWIDYRNGINYDVYAQHVLASGVADPAWPADGRALCTALDYQGGTMIGPDGTGGAIVTWYDRRSGTNYDIYAQRVLASGAIAPNWPANGRALCTAAGDQFTPMIATDGAGGAVITWVDGRAGGGTYAQHVLASGAVDPAWPINGRSLSNTGGWPAIIPDGAGGAIVTWRRYSTAYDIYAHHILASGAVDPVWPASGRALSTAPEEQTVPRIAEDGAGGAIVTWQDHRSGTNFDIYAQRVQANGQLGGDLPTTALASLADVDVHEGTVRLRWYLSLDEPVTVTVYRSTVANVWLALGRVAPDGSGYASYEDAGATAGARHGYRLGLRPAVGDERFAGEVWVDVPLPSADLAVRVQNPVVGGEVTVSFAAPTGRLVRVSLLDLAGRTVATRLVAGGGGRQSAGLAQSSDLVPGLYLLRIELDRPVVARVVVIR